MSFAATHPAASFAPRAVAMPVEFFAGLREGVLAAHQDGAGLPLDALRDAVRDAGYHAGQALFDQFAGWLLEQGEAGPMELADERFAMLLEAFFHAHGWGTVELAPLSDAVMTLDARDWSEAGHTDGGCLVSTGLFSGFLGRLAGAPISVLEVDPGTTQPGRCRFLVGSIEVLDYVWDAMQRGVPYEQAAHNA